MSDDGCTACYTGEPDDRHSCATSSSPTSLPEYSATLPTTANGWELPPPEVIKADPATCPHAVLDEMAGIPWGFEDCVTCGKRFPMRTEYDDAEAEAWFDYGTEP